MIEAKTTYGVNSNGAYRIPDFRLWEVVDADSGIMLQHVKILRVAAMFAELAPLMAATWDTIEEANTSDMIFEIIDDLKGVGPFVAWQVCLDLGYINPEIYDQTVHVYAGPGAIGG